MRALFQSISLKSTLKSPWLWFGIIAIVTVLIQKSISVKFSYDSSWYIIFANRISESWDFTRHAVYAPLYSWSLGALSLLGFDIITSIVIYWGISFFLMLTVFYLLTRNFGFTLIAFLAVFSNLTTASLFRYAWTELGYSVLLITAVFALYKVVKSENSRYKWVFLVAIALLPVQRYIGGFICVYLGLIYLLYSRKHIFKRTIELAAAAIPTVLVVIWNYSLSGHFSGDRKAAEFGFYENLMQTRSVLYHNFSPEWFLYLLAPLALLVLIRKRKQPAALFFIFLLPFIQVLAQLYGSSTYYLFYITPRFFIVLTPLMILLIMIALKEVFKENKGYYNYGFLAVFFVLIASNLLALNNRHYLVEEQPEVSYEKTKAFIDNIPTDEIIGVYSKNTECRQAEFILTAKIIPEDRCQKYRVLGDNRTNDIRYVPDCKNSAGHKYIPVNDLINDRPTFLLMDKERLKEGWQEIYSGYEIEDLGPFYGLTKEN